MNNYISKRFIFLKKRIKYLFALLLIAYLILLIPLEKKEMPVTAGKKQFVWNRDSLWTSLEKLYAESRKMEPGVLAEKIAQSQSNIKEILNDLRKRKYAPDDPELIKFESMIFYSAALTGAAGKGYTDFINLFSELRSLIKMQSREWDLNDLTARQTLYKIIYGGRAALEELLLQPGKEEKPTLVLGDDEYSETPYSEIMGIKIHSGDILVSRGGAPTSALISRGSDYPGNFSHIALAYVDSKDKKLSLIEAHIEKGVTVSSIDDYLNDKKLRIMVLRVRNDLPQIANDKMLPHKAALAAFNRASSMHIAYDFAMNYNDTLNLFCSEVASSAYIKYGVNLWKGLSSISSAGVAGWLYGFGVRNFITLEPSDLEYDSQLTVVAEWRDPSTLFKDHIDNAIVEALLEEADRGAELTYDWYLLPIARIMKLYSSVLNLFGSVGPVPEGMSPESALRHKKLVSIHNDIFSEIEKDAEDFVRTNGYTPPYWRLVEFARKAIASKSFF